jgi:hypothetical protein
MAGLRGGFAGCYSARVTEGSLRGKGRADVGGVRRELEADNAGGADTQRQPTRGQPDAKPSCICSR